MSEGQHTHKEGQRVVIVGAGKLGTALMDCPGLNNGSLRVVAAFDRDPGKQGTHGTIPILPVEQLRPFIFDHEITVGVIALPSHAAQRIADLMVLGGIRGILNFTPTSLRLPKRCLEKQLCLGQELNIFLSLVQTSIRAGKEGN